MTVNESIHNLFIWFSKNDSFNLEENFKSLFPNYLSDTLDADKASLICALKELEKNNIVRTSSFNKKDYYIIDAPLNTLSQNVSLSASTCMAISDIINKTKVTMERDELSINPLQINETDILTALSILADLNYKANTKHDHGK